MLVIIGKLTDKVSPKIMIPGCFILNSVIYFAMYFCLPGSISFYIVSPFFAVSMLGSVVVVLGYLNKMVPIEVRGAMASLKVFWFSLNILVFNIICAKFYDMDTGYPWFVIAAASLFVGVFTIIMALCGYISRPE